MPAILAGQKFLPNDGGRTSTARRLVVVVPNQDLDAVSFSRAIRSLADSHLMDVLLVTVVHNEEDELAARRCLATVSTLMRDFVYDIEAHVVWSRSWIAALEKLSHPSDLVLCPPELNIRTGLRKHEPLSAVISRRLGLAVRPMPGFYKEERVRITRFLLKLGYWVVILGILGGFFVLESDVTTVSTGWVSQVLLIILMAAEIGTIYLWTMITG
jgi:hypothetical protein